ncbi:MAG: hypothetical protein HFF84_09435 [Oscillibacter sp.]|nr:hypothetical protein [Oscillibacter sp.]
MPLEPRREDCLLLSPRLRQRMERCSTAYSRKRRDAKRIREDSAFKDAEWIQLLDTWYPRPGKERNEAMKKRTHPNKRGLALFFALALCTGLLQLPVFAEEFEDVVTTDPECTCETQC